MFFLEMLLRHFGHVTIKYFTDFMFVIHLSNIFHSLRYSQAIEKALINDRLRVSKVTPKISLSNCS